MHERSRVESNSNENFYDEDSVTYDDQRWETKAGKYTNQQQQAIVADLCNDWTDSHILEVGPGTARFTIPLLERQNRMTLVDVSEGMLDVAKKRIEKAGSGNQVEKYVKGSAYSLPFEDESFDHLISINVFNHLDQSQNALKEYARVLRSGSTLLFNYLNLHSFYWPAGLRVNQRNKAVGQDVYSIWHKPREIREMLPRVGLELVEMRGQTHMPRAMERFHLGGVVRFIDGLSRSGILSSFAALHFCLCRKC